MDEPALRWIAARVRSGLPVSALIVAAEFGCVLVTAERLMGEDWARFVQEEPPPARPVAVSRPRCPRCGGQTFADDGEEWCFACGTLQVARLTPEQARAEHCRADGRRRRREASHAGFRI